MGIRGLEGGRNLNFSRFKWWAGTNQKSPELLDSTMVSEIHAWLLPPELPSPSEPVAIGTIAHRRVTTLSCLSPASAFRHQNRESLEPIVRFQGVADKSREVVGKCLWRIVVAFFSKKAPLFSMCLHFIDVKYRVKSVPGTKPVKYWPTSPVVSRKVRGPTKGSIPANTMCWKIGATIGAARAGVAPSAFPSGPVGTLSLEPLLETSEHVDTGI